MLTAGRLLSAPRGALTNGRRGMAGAILISPALVLRSDPAHPISLARCSDDIDNLDDLP
jgi:hypothetical protein